MRMIDMNRKDLGERMMLMMMMMISRITVESTFGRSMARICSERREIRMVSVVCCRPQEEVVDETSLRLSACTNQDAVDECLTVVTCGACKTWFDETLFQVSRTCCVFVGTASHSFLVVFVIAVVVSAKGTAAHSSSRMNLMGVR